MVDAVRDAFGETPEQVLADAGYCSEPNLQALKEPDIRVRKGGRTVVDGDNQVVVATTVAGKITPYGEAYDDFLYRPDAKVKLEAFPLYFFNSLLEEGRILYPLSNIQ